MRHNSAGTQSQTNVPALDAETYASSQSDTPVPWFVGEAAPVIRWITPIYGQRTVKSGSSSKKGGSSQSTKYYGTCAGVICEDGFDNLLWILNSGKLVWSGDISRSTSSNPVSLTLEGIGRLDFYWGTETQAASSVLNTYEEHPPYKGVCYAVLVDGCFGENGETSAPMLKFCGRRRPNQSIVSGSVSDNDGYYTGNPMAIAAEVLTSWDWASIPAAKINASSFQTVGNAIEAEVVNGRSSCAVAPFITSGMDLQALLGDIGSIADTCFRFDSQGRVEAKRWVKNATVNATYTTLTFNDLTDQPQVDSDDQDDLANSFTVEFRDSGSYHKANGVPVDNTAVLAHPGVTPISKTLDMKAYLLNSDMSRRFGMQYLARYSVPTMRGTYKVRREKCVNPDASAIRPGDYFAAPISRDPLASPVEYALFRCVGRKFGMYGDIQLQGEREVNAQPIALTPEAPDKIVISDAVPPISCYRVIEVPADFSTDGPEVLPLAARPSGMASAFDFTYSDTLGGDYAFLGRNQFALPMRLYASLGSSATTIRVQTHADSYADYTRDLHYLTEWQGGTVEGRDDQLLMVLVSKSGSVVSEVLSVNGTATIVSAGVYDVPVLRGRLGTTALTCSGSFPDAWSSYEVWVLPRSAYERVTHADFTGLLSSGTAHFRMSAAGIYGTYDPATAYAEKQRLAGLSKPLGDFYYQANSSTFAPEIAFTFPSGGLPSINAFGSAKVVTLTADSTIFKVTAAGVYSPSSVTITATAQNCSGSPVFTVDSGTATLGGTGASRTLNYTDLTTTAATIKVTWDGQVAKITISKVADGATGPAGANGTNGTNGSNNAKILIYQRAASTPSLPSATCTYTFSTSTLTGLNNGWSTSIPAANGYPCYASAASAISASDTASITSGQWASAVVMAQDGSSGVNSATVYLYQRSASAPGVPSASLTYTFATGVLSGTLGSWSQTVPASNGNPCYVTLATAVSTGTSDTITTGEWSTPTLLVRDGSDSTSYWITATAGSLTKSNSGVFTPTQVTFTAYAKTGTSGPVAYNGRWIFAETTDGVNYTDKWTSSADGNGLTYAPTTNTIKMFRARLYLAGGTTTLLDEWVVNVVNDGANGSGGGIIASATAQPDITTTGWQTAVSVAVTLSAGQTVQITGSGTLANNLSGGMLNTQIKIQRGSTDIGEVVRKGTVAGSGYSDYTLVRTDTPGAGTFTYYIMVYTSTATVDYYAYANLIIQ